MDCRGVSSLCGLYCTIIIFIPIFKWGSKYYVQTSCCGKTYKLDNEVGRAIEKGEPIVISQNDLEYEGQTPVIKNAITVDM